MIGQRVCRLESCRRQFWPHRADQKFCSVWCRRAAWKLAHGSGEPTSGGAPPACCETSITPFTAA